MQEDFMHNRQAFVDTNSGESMYDAKNLRTVINLPGIRGMLSPAYHVTCLNFGREKIRFLSNRGFKPGQRLVVDLSIGSVLAHELNAVISSVHQEEDSWSCDADFCINQKHGLSPLLNRALLNIEHYLKMQASYPTG
jgi:hypothetical protein